MKKIVMTLPALMFVFAFSSASQAAVKANYNKSMPKSVCFATTELPIKQIILGTKKATKIEMPPVAFVEGAKSVKASLSQVQALTDIYTEEPDDANEQTVMGSGTGTAVQYKGTDDETGEKVDITEYNAEWRSTYFGGEGGLLNFSEVFDLYWSFNGKTPIATDVWIKDEQTGDTTWYPLTEINCKTGQVKYPGAAPPMAKSSRARNLMK